MRYTPELALRVATYFLVYDGLAALYLGGLFGVAAALGVALAVATTWGDPGLGVRVRRQPGLAAALAVAGVTALVLDLVYVATSVLDGLVHVLVFLVLYRLAVARTPRETGDVGFLAFFMLVAASPVTVGVGFLGLFIAFLVVGTWLLMLRHVVMECERSQAPGARTLPARGRVLLQLSLLASAVTLALTAVLFFIIPRVGQAALPLRAPLGRMVSGFTDRVELGSFGEIEADATVAMRVHFAAGLPASPVALRGLRWRGVVLDSFDGHAWSMTPRPRTLLRRSPGGDVTVSVYRGTGPLVSQEIFLEPIGTEVVFGAPRMLRLAIHAPVVAMDEAGGLTVTVPAARLHYTVESELELVSPRVVAAANRPLPEAERAALGGYLALPPQRPRVAALAREKSAGGAGPYDAAERLTRFLSEEFRYTRALERRTTLDPVEEFLFERRAGNCEYFAASLAVMLRTLDIPARVVNGFQRGEWNPYGQYFMVRMRDAHSWVEAYFAGVGWLTFDPSPRADADERFAAPGAMSLYLDALRLRWYRYVINWSLRDQVAAATNFQRAAGAWRAGALPDWRTLPRRVPLIAGGLAVLAAAALVVRRRRAPASPRTVPPFYRRALALLARRGLAPAREETAREFCARAGHALPAAAVPFTGLTAVYERARFGAALATADETDAVAAWLLALRRLPRAASVSGEGRRRAPARHRRPPQS
ncbi:MAG TPA: transglutaminaseTgpA domain-containing protein [Methylomirabilota bacterium]